MTFLHADCACCAGVHAAATHMLRSLVDLSLDSAPGCSLLGTSVGASYGACIASLHAECACCAGVYAAATHHAP